MSTVRMYALQAAFANMDATLTPNTFYTPPPANSSIDSSTSVPTPITLSASTLHFPSSLVHADTPASSAASRRRR